jgi:hypothetical protein
VSKQSDYAKEGNKVAYDNSSNNSVDEIDKGRVLDEWAAAPGVTIIVKGTNKEQRRI